MVVRQWVLTAICGFLPFMAIADASATSGTSEASTTNPTTNPNSASKIQNFVGLASADQGYFEMLPSTSFSLGLLKERNQFNNHALNLGGYFEFDTQYWNAHSSGIVTGAGDQLLPNEGVGLYTTTVDLDAMSNLNDWTTFFGKIEQEDMGTPQAHMIFRKAFVTFGNLNKSPLFLTAGKTFLPFGVYGGGGVWSVPMTRAVFRPSEVPQVLLGYFKNGFNSNLAVFGDNGTQQVADYVYSVFYAGTVQNSLGYTVGAGYLNDLRGLPSSLGSAYQSDGELDSSKRVPAYDLNAQVSYENLDITGEFISALRQGTYNSNVSTTGQTVVSAGQAQGLPSAWELGAAYNQPLLGKLMYYSLSYSRDYHMAGIPMGWTSQPNPGSSAVDGVKSAWIASAARELAPNLLLGLEWQRGKTYNDNYGDSYTLDLSMYF